MSVLRSIAAVFGLAGLLALATAMPAAGNDKPGRYVMQPVGGGVLRLDTETGQMALCTVSGAGVVCEPVQEPAATDRQAERLAAENRELKAEIKRLEEMLAEAARAPAVRQPRLELPSEEDVDKALSYMERMVKKFRDKMKELDAEPGRGNRL